MTAQGVEGHQEESDWILKIEDFQYKPPSVKIIPEEEKKRIQNVQARIHLHILENAMEVDFLVIAIYCR